MNGKEIKRQLVHLSGIIAVFVSLYIGSFYTGIGALVISFGIMFLSWYVKCKEDIRDKLPLRIKTIEKLEDETHEFVNGFDRESDLCTIPYYGAFMFFLAIGLVFLVFDLHAAIYATLVLSISDSLSTIFGIHFGKRKIFYNEKKTLEGSLAFFISCLLVSIYFFSLPVAIITSFILAFVETIPGIDDNLSIPLIAAFILTVVL